MEKLKARARGVLVMQDPALGSAVADLLDRELDEVWVEDPKTGHPALMQEDGALLLGTATYSLVDRLARLKNGAFLQAVCGVPAS